MRKSKQARGNKLPPFLAKRKCTTEENCKQYIKSVFDMLWFHAVFQTEDAASVAIGDKLLAWKDLVEENPTRLKDLCLMVHVIFQQIETDDCKLLPFLDLCLKRAIS